MFELITARPADAVGLRGTGTGSGSIGHAVRAFADAGMDAANGSRRDMEGAPR